MTNQSPDDKSVELQKQIGILQQQLALVNAQLALNTAKQTQESNLAKAITEALKNQTIAQFSLESEQAKLPLAELSGIKSALGNAKLPEGKSGTIQIAAGIAGTALLRSKAPMLNLLLVIADELNKRLPDGAVVITEVQLEQAYQAKIMLKRIEEQTKKLKKAIEEAMPKLPVAQPMVLGEFAAAAYSVGFVLESVNSLAKLFRVDRKADVFAADTEALQMLGYMLESKSTKFVANPSMIREEAVTAAENLLNKLNDLHIEIQLGDDKLATLKKIKEEEAKTKPSSSQLPDTSVVSGLKAQTEAAKSILDGLRPDKKPDSFWAQVKGQLIWKIIEDRDRLMIEAKAQAIQITESRWWRSDSTTASGEVQVAYRVLDKDGKVKKTGVILKASKAGVISFNEMREFSFP